ncbi:MAG: hypothetical protein A3G18_03845 [Rhodospirillales bacterium RIFCSPLOWO2_12_FULL_58_28]|nr:MAG: hypothetical protein A3H92_01785 [Rhodospirillales bacterium RIFCSPLOWO2_02_FULL_58_16]OHC78105.1 MAG: hypothetical protein A3G18_03845 [Rhodospirillales bacterium RIFCSPLOWO2_12_FULL_58_28]
MTKKASPKPKNVVVFDLAGMKCAIPSPRLREVVLMPLLTRGPGLPSILEGIMNIEGEAVAVLRLDRLFGLPEKKPDLYTPLLVLKGTEIPVALLVDRVQEVSAVGDDDIMPFNGDDAFNGCIEAELTKDGKTIHLLSVDHILLEREQRCIAEFHAVEQERLGRLDGAT